MEDVTQVCFFHLPLTKIKLNGTEACHFLLSTEQRALPYLGKGEIFFKRLFVFCRSSVCIKVESLHGKCFAWLTILLLKAERRYAVLSFLQINTFGFHL